MRLKKSIIILVAISLFLLGCQQKAQTGAPTGPYSFQGDTALEVHFARDAPVVLDTDPYAKGENIDVAVELLNKLPEAIPAGKIKVRLTGDAAIPNFFSGAKEAANPELNPIDPTTGSPTPEELELGPLKYLADLPAKTSKQLSGEFCYEMPLKVVAFLYYTNKQGEINVNLPATSNPPSRIKVTSLEQRPVSVRDGKAEMSFDVTIQNLGTGMLVDSLNDCFKFRERSEREKLRLTAKGAYPVECENGGEVLLSRETKMKKIRCTVSGIDPNRLGPEASELALTLDSFAYQEDLAPVTIWLEP
ncbi:hypothetical protein HY501_03500 [Candidatus Woesearchaeota archaeon]|nr:hypothetical protein [Candidatus Woesearchaeota archaeon]